MLFVGGPRHGQDVKGLNTEPGGKHPATYTDMTAGVPVLYRLIPVRVPASTGEVWERSVYLAPDVPPQGPEHFQRVLLDAIGAWWMKQPPGRVVDPTKESHELPETAGQVAARSADHQAGCVTEGQRYVGTMLDRAKWLREHQDQGHETWVDCPPIEAAAPTAAEAE